MKNYYQDEKIIGINYSNIELAKEYDTCHFLNCDFSLAKLSDVVFTECLFENCNLSSAKINNTSFQQVVFKSCKMLGLQFDGCNELSFSVSFENCVLNHSSFYKISVQNTMFLECQLKETDFSQADLSQSKFNECDLSLATFDRTNLSNANLKTAVNFSIDPTKNNIQKTKFSSTNIQGLVDCFNIVIEP